MYLCSLPDYWGKVGCRHLDCINNILHAIVPADLELRAANVYHGLYNSKVSSCFER